MEKYNDLKDKVISSLGKTATEFIPKMYDALREGEKRDPMDCRDIIIHDLIPYLSRDYIVSLLPDECKNKDAQNLRRKNDDNQSYAPAEAGQQEQISISVESTGKSGATGGGGSASLASAKSATKKPEEKITIPKVQYDELITRNESLNEKAYKAMRVAKDSEKTIKSLIDDKDALVEEIGKLRAVIDKNSSSSSQASPISESPGPEPMINDMTKKQDNSPGIQWNMDKFLSVKDVIHLAHIHECPAQCETWRKAQAIEV